MLTPKEMLENICWSSEGGRYEIDPVKLASYLASIQPKEEEDIWMTSVPSKDCSHGLNMVCIKCEQKPRPKEEEKVEPPLLSIPRPKGWRVGHTLVSFIEWVNEKGIENAYDVLDATLDRYYQEFLKQNK
jgi:hypothetical protein